MKKDSPVHIRLFIALIVSATVIRFFYCFQYLHTDEYVTFWDAMKFIREKTLISHHTVYPPFYSYVSTLAISIWAAMLRILNVIPSMKSLSSFFYMHSITAIFPARLLSLAYSIGLLACVYVTGTRFLNKTTGLCSAAIIAFSIIHVESAAVGLPDMQMAFFATLSFYCALHAYHNPSIRWYALSGLCTGLAASSKYNGIFSAFFIIIVHIMHLHQRRTLLHPTNWMWKHGATALVMCIGGFFVCSPGLLIKPVPYITSIASASAKMSSGMLAAYQGTPYFAFIDLFFQYEPMWAILFFCGIGYGLYRHNRHDLIMIIPIMLAFFLLGRWKIQSLKYFLFLSAPIALPAGQCLVFLLNKVANKPLRIVLYALIFSVPAYTTSLAALHQLGTDNRTQAAEWINRNIPDGSRILLDRAGWSIYHHPRLYTADEKEQYLSDNPLFFTKRLDATNTYPLQYEVVSEDILHNTDAEYFITTSYWYRAFFEYPEISQRNPCYDEHHRQKKIYEQLFFSPSELGWNLVKQFDSPKGPVILVFKKMP